MRLFIDIGHPAHVHYFKNFIKIMEAKGHEFLVVARDREVIHSLLRAEKIKFHSRGKGAKSFIGKLLYTIWADLCLFYHSVFFRPDIYLSHSSHYAMHIARLFGKPCISTADSDHIKMNAKWLMPYLDALLTPTAYKLDYGEKHLTFNGYMELLYLHPNNFKPQKDKVRKVLGLEENEKFFLLRFVAWDAFHDSKQAGFTNEQKTALVDYLSNHGRVIISSEGALPPSLEKYQAKFPPVLLHDVLAEATICISEGATTASEAAVLGTPTVYVNSLEASNCREQEEVYKLNHCFPDGDGVLDNIARILNQENLDTIYSKRRERLIEEKIDVTAFLVWFIENYPDSKSKYRRSPSIQEQFKSETIDGF